VGLGQPDVKGLGGIFVACGTSVRHLC
jgi:hypothetical protein